MIYSVVQVVRKKNAQYVSINTVNTNLSIASCLWTTETVHYIRVHLQYSKLAKVYILRSMLVISGSGLYPGFIIERYN